MKYYLQIREIENDFLEDKIQQSIKLEVASRDEAMTKANLLKDSFENPTIEFITWNHDEGTACEKEILTI